MINRVYEKDKPAILAFLYEEPEINLYIIANIKNFGLDHPDHDLYAEIRDEQIFAVCSRHLNQVIYYQVIGEFNDAWCAVLNQLDFSFISGKYSVIKRVAPYFPQLHKDELAFMRSTTFTPDDTLDMTPIKKLKTARDAKKVTQFLNTIEELFSVRSQSEEDYVAYLLQNSDDNGTTVYIEMDNHVVASASAVYETQKSAMIVGVATHEAYRQQGFGKLLMTYLIDYYVNKKAKTLCLYYDDPRAESLYKSYGFEDIERWMMLIKKDDNA